MRPTRLEISRTALVRNIASIRAAAPGRLLIAVVKANAYGHGMKLVCSVIEPYVDMFGVAFVEEGIELRNHGISKPIIVLMTPTEGDIQEAITHGLELVLCSLPFARDLDRLAQRAHKRLRAHVYVDTGMHRDGVHYDRVLPVVQQCSKLPNIELAGICTHLASSDHRDYSMTQLQNERFAWVLDMLSTQGYHFPLIHAANTGAVFNHPLTHYSAVRVGIGIYGIAPGHVEAPALIPAMKLKSCITAIRRVEAGEFVGYGTYYSAQQPTFIATVPLGYGDGYSRMLSGRAECLIRGNRYPIVGAICMDECLVDIGNEQINVGEPVIFIGQQGDQIITVQELAERIGTIPYEITTLLNTRLERVLVE